MLVGDVRKMEPLEILVYWIKERESIRLKREQGEKPPWTDDWILATYRFCNVRRMDDKVSQWLWNNWYKPNHNHPNMLVAAAIARFVNQPSSLEALGFPSKWEPEKFKKRLREYRDAGNTVFNAAYMVRGNDGVDKIESVVDYYVAPLSELRDRVNSSSMEETWRVILSSYGMGSFMAGQIVADLRWAVKGNWLDRNVFAPVGPGSTKGLNRLKGRKLLQSIKQSQFVEELAGIIAHCKGKLLPSITNRLEAHDYQNCLCEIFKYMKTLYGEGKPKQLYRSKNV